MVISTVLLVVCVSTGVNELGSEDKNVPSSTVTLTLPFSIITTSPAVTPLSEKLKFWSG